MFKVRKWIALAPLMAASLLAPPGSAIADVNADGDTASRGTSEPVLTPAAKRAGERAAPSSRTPTVEEALTAYWTSERMRDARPAAESPAVKRQLRAHKRAAREDAAAARSGALALPPKPAGPEGRVEPAAPDEHSPAVAQDGGPSATAAPKGARAAAVPSSFPYDSFPARTAGKVFFTDASSGLNYVCSGTIVNSEGKNSVWTAGHCVHGGSGGTWHANWVFVPSYDSGWAPYGLWSAAQLWTKTTWISSGEWASDIGMAAMQRRNGWRIVDYLGGQGITWNRSKRTAMTAFGYPADAPFDGMRLWTCSDASFPEWEFLWISAETLGLVCDMTGGSSGGGWLASFDGTTGYLDGNNSFKYTNDPARMYSPYYDDTAASLYAATRFL